jgi:hypothetical protein
MDNYTIKLAQLLQNAQPSQGGLSVGDYPNQYQNQYANGGGLRAWQNPNGSYGGQMMPKTSGWQGEIQAIDPKRKITEYSMGGENGEPFFPSVTQNMTPEQIQNVRLLEAGQISQNSPQAQAVREKALQEYKNKTSQGLSPFKDYN